MENENLFKGIGMVVDDHVYTGRTHQNAFASKSFDR